MPIKRTYKKKSSRISNIEKQVEIFASKAELKQKERFNKNDLPTIGMTIKLNKYEHKLLKKVSKAKSRSMQKQIKRILIRELEKIQKQIL